MKKTLEKPDPVPVHYSSFDGGKIIAHMGMLDNITSDHVLVQYLDEVGVGHIARFRRGPGPTSGWGVGVARHWRLSEPERKRYCHPDIPMRSHR